MPEIVAVNDEVNIWYFIGASSVDNCVYVGTVTSTFIEKRLWYIHEIRRYNSLLKFWDTVASIQTQNNHYSASLSTDNSEIGILTLCTSCIDIFTIDIHKKLVCKFGLESVGNIGGQQCKLFHSSSLGWIVCNPQQNFTFSQCSLLPNTKKPKENGKIALKEIFTLLAPSTENEKIETSVTSCMIRNNSAYCFCRVRYEHSEENKVHIYDLTLSEPKPISVPMGLEGENVEVKVPELKDFYGKLFWMGSDLCFASTSLHRIGSKRVNLINLFQFDLPPDTVPSRTFSWKFLKRIQLPEDRKIVAPTALLHACSDGKNLFTKLLISIKEENKELVRKSRPSVDRIGLIPLAPLSLQAYAVKTISPWLKNDASQEEITEQFGVSRRIVSLWFRYNASGAEEPIIAKKKLGKLRNLFSPRKL